MGITLGARKSGSLNVMHEMKKGDDGGYYIPEVDAQGNLTWEASEEDMPEIPGANIRGVQGIPGEKGDRGQDGIRFVHIGADEPTDENCLVWLYTEPNAIQASEGVGF